MNTKRIGLLVALLVLVAVAAGLATLGPWSGQAPRPSIILIVIDTLRPDHLGCYGYDLDTSPNIDAFAADGVVFENCKSQSSDTRLSMASMLSGFYPHETKVIGAHAVPEEVELLSEMLKPEGYKTAAVIGNFMLHRGWNYKQGFDIYDDEMNEHELVRQHFKERTAGATTDRAIEILEQSGDEPLFLWVHYQDPHGTYTPPKEYGDMMKRPGVAPRTMQVNDKIHGRGGIPSYQKLGDHTDYHHYVAQYDGEIRYVDENLKRLMQALKDHGHYDDALIILTSDHGEGMGEQDWYFAHGWNVYEPLIHVPFIVKYGRKLSGRRKDTVQLLDVVPTIVNLLDIEVSSSFRGRDFLRPLGKGRPIFSEISGFDGYVASVNIDGLKLIKERDRKVVKLYDLNQDPLEEHNLRLDQSRDAELLDLHRQIVRMIDEDRLQIAHAGGPREIDEDEMQQIKSLGYTK